MTPTSVVWKSFSEMAQHVFESLNPDFPKKVQKGDIIVAGRNFGCSSGRAIAPKAIKATGVAAIVAEGFSRTFYRNGHEVGLPILEVAGIHELANTGDRLRVDITTGVVTNLSTGRSIQGSPAPEFLRQMLEAGGLIPFLKTGQFLNR
jgi:3-isopropylmalate/(R)-2-methylmalate dehydratase small subunit